MDQAFPPFLHTAGNQKLDGGKAWERGRVGQVNKFDIVVLGRGAVLKADEGIKVALPLNCNNQWVNDTKSMLTAKLTFEPL